MYHLANAAQETVICCLPLGIFGHPCMCKAHHCGPVCWLHRCRQLQSEHCLYLAVRAVQCRNTGSLSAIRLTHPCVPLIFWPTISVVTVEHVTGSQRTRTGGFCSTLSHKKVLGSWPLQLPWNASQCSRSEECAAMLFMSWAPILQEASLAII